MKTLNNNSQNLTTLSNRTASKIQSLIEYTVKELPQCEYFRGWSI